MTCARPRVRVIREKRHRNHVTEAEWIMVEKQEIMSGRWQGELQVQEVPETSLRISDSLAGLTESSKAITLTVTIYHSIKPQLQSVRGRGAEGGILQNQGGILQSLWLSPSKGVVGKALFSQPQVWQYVQSVVIQGSLAKSLPWRLATQTHWSLHGWCWSPALVGVELVHVAQDSCSKQCIWHRPSGIVQGLQVKTGIPLVLCIPRM